MNYKFIDARALAKETPYTFFVPKQEHLNSLKTGNFVKLIFVSTSNEADAERMWVEITEIKNSLLIGKLVNNPRLIKVKYGEIVKFKYENIINIERDNASSSKTNNLDAIDKFCIVSNRVLNSKIVGYLYREEPIDSDDSGWRILTGDESDEYLDNEDNFEYVSVASVLNIDDSFLGLLREKIDSHFELDLNTNTWLKI